MPHSGESASGREYRRGVRGSWIRLKIGVIGAGVSGLTAAWRLARQHDVILFEREYRLGGHAHTHLVTACGRAVPVDTGFMVFNERTYPHFVRMLDELGVASRPSEPIYIGFGGRSLENVTEPTRIAMIPTTGTAIAMLPAAGDQIAAALPVGTTDTAR